MLRFGFLYRSAPLEMNARFLFKVRSKRLGLRGFQHRLEEFGIIDMCLGHGTHLQQAPG